MMAVHRSLLLFVALSALLSTSWALSKGSVAESAELDGSSESAMSAEPEIPGEEDGRGTKRPLTVTHRLQVELTLGERGMPRVTKRRSRRGGRNTRSATSKGRRRGGLKGGSSKVSGKGSATGSAIGNLAHNLRGAGYAGLAGEGSAKASGEPINHCAKCPRSTWSRHSGYTKKSSGAESGALLPSSFCPRRSKEYLASEAIAAMTAAGYTRTAKYLRESEILLSVNKPATLLVPMDEAYESVTVPRADQEPSLGALMSLHILEGMYSFEELQKSPDMRYSTLYPKAQLEAKVYQDGDFSSITFRQVPAPPTAHPALVVKKDVFCNSLVIVHVVNQVLEPQGSRAWWSAVAQEEVPHDSAALKEMAGTVRDMDM